MLGLSVRALDVRLEDDLALTGETLKTAYDEDFASGRRPFILSEGAVTFSSYYVYSHCFVW